MSLSNLNQGQDSFLDIIANLVGVLIILVVIVGAQATSRLVAQRRPPETETEIVVAAAEDDRAFEARKSKMESELATLAAVSDRLRNDRIRLQRQTDREKLLSQQLATRRHAMLMQLETVRAIHQQRKREILQELDQKQREQLRLESEKIRLVSQLESLQSAVNAVAASRIESTVETIDHYPNPIAKTVFSDEIHFRLDRDRLAYVPMEELVEKMNGEIRLKAEKLRQSDGTRETVGPVRGFRLQYELDVVPADQTPRPNARIVRRNWFRIQPVDADIGEPVEDALREGSNFMKILGRLEPRRTTVSIWVYANSFDSHSKLKEWLHKRGFQMASWPLSEGRAISGGPDGFRTSAQ